MKNYKNIYKLIETKKNEIIKQEDDFYADVFLELINQLDHLQNNNLKILLIYANNNLDQPFIIDIQKQIDNQTLSLSIKECLDDKTLSSEIKKNIKSFFELTILLKKYPRIDSIIESGHYIESNSNSIYFSSDKTKDFYQQTLANNEANILNDNLFKSNSVNAKKL